MMKLSSLGPSCLAIVAVALLAGCSGSSSTPSPTPPPSTTLYVVDNGNPPISVTSFKQTDTGNVAPQTTIAGAATGLISPKAVWRDAAGSIYVGQNDEESGACPPTKDTGSILVFAPGANHRRRQHHP